LSVCENPAGPQQLLLSLDWAGVMAASDPDEEANLRRCTYSGKPYGDPDFLRGMSQRFDRHWTRGRPKKKEPDSVSPGRSEEVHQMALFGG
jgi:hypothetical protein